MHTSAHSCLLCPYRTAHLDGALQAARQPRMTDEAMTLHTRLATSAQQAYVCQVKVGWHIVPKCINGCCVIGFGSGLLGVE